MGAHESQGGKSAIHLIGYALFAVNPVGEGLASPRGSAGN
jgi:hypothetical protein